MAGVILFTSFNESTIKITVLYYLQNNIIQNNIMKNEVGQFKKGGNNKQKK